VKETQKTGKVYLHGTPRRESREQKKDEEKRKIRGMVKIVRRLRGHEKIK